MGYILILGLGLGQVEANPVLANAFNTGKLLMKRVSAAKEIIENDSENAKSFLEISQRTQKLLNQESTFPRINAISRINREFNLLYVKFVAERTLTAMQTANENSKNVEFFLQLSERAQNLLNKISSMHYSDPYKPEGAQTDRRANDNLNSINNQLNTIYNEADKINRELEIIDVKVLLEKASAISRSAKAAQLENVEFFVQILEHAQYLLDKISAPISWTEIKTYKKEVKLLYKMLESLTQTSTTPSFVYKIPTLRSDITNPKIFGEFAVKPDYSNLAEKKELAKKKLFKKGLISNYQTALFVYKREFTEENGIDQLLETAEKIFSFHKQIVVMGHITDIMPESITQLIEMRTKKNEEGHYGLKVYTDMNGLSQPFSDIEANKEALICFAADFIMVPTYNGPIINDNPNKTIFSTIEEALMYLGL